MSNPTLASITAELEAVETAARGRGSLTCDHLAGRIANIRGELQQIAQPQPPAEAQACGCGKPACVEPWEPVCDLGKSEQHAVVQAQSVGEVLSRIEGKLREAGARLPAPPVKGTIESAVVTGLSIALALVEAEAATPSAPVGVEAAEAMGARGGPASESERLAFEAWMRGHCWALCATWDGTGYRSDAEQGGRYCPNAGRTRGLWAAWRDRAALAQQPAAVDEAIRRDAERYRWLRLHANTEWEAETVLHVVQAGGRTLDLRIDEALAAQQGGES